MLLKRNDTKCKHKPVTQPHISQHLTHSCLTLGFACDGKTGQKFFFLLFSVSPPRVRSRSPRSESNLQPSYMTNKNYLHDHFICQQ